MQTEKERHELTEPKTSANYETLRVETLPVVFRMTIPNTVIPELLKVISLLTLVLLGHSML